MILTAARANEISMFGDINASRLASFHARPGIALKQHTFTEVGMDSDPTIDAQGLQMAFSSTRHNMQPDIYIKAIDGVAVTQLTSDPASDVQPRFSPDGSRVAFASNRSGNWDIWVIKLDGGQPVQVTNTPHDEVQPSWSPDGNRLVFSSLSARGGQWELWVANATNGASREFIGYGLFPEWSPVNDTILFQRARERGSRLFSVWTVQLNQGEPQYPTEMASSANQALTLPTWSQDGTHIAFVSVPYTPFEEVANKPGLPARSDIWVMSSTGHMKVRLTDGMTANYAPAFAPDGRVYFATGRDGSDTIWSLWPTSPSSLPTEDGRVTTGNQNKGTSTGNSMRPEARTVSTGSGR